MTESFKQSLISERCTALHAFNSSAELAVMLSSGSGDSSVWGLLVVPRRILGLHDLDGLSYVNVTQACLEAASLPRHEALAGIKTAMKTHRPKLGMLAGTLMPALVRIYEIEVRCVARAACARMALAVEQYRLSTGRLPETLDQLVPTLVSRVPLDPFDGLPLRFRPLDTGYVVYSVGQDLMDNQGEAQKTGSDRKHQTTWDETFTVIRRDSQ